MQSGKRTETVSSRMELDLIEFMDRRCAVASETHSDYLRRLVMEDRAREFSRWSKLRPVFDRMPDLQDKQQHEVD